MARKKTASPEKIYVRFDIVQRVQHFLFLISFTLLGLTGLPQKYSTSPISVAFFDAIGGIEVARAIHHTSAIVMMIVSVFHVLELLYRVFVLRTPISMIPWISDAIHVYEDVLYYLGFRERKAYYGRYSYAEKMEYLALVWGTVVMGVTGFMMWNPISTIRFLPGEFVPASKAAHGGEAVLAVLAIIIWHFYHVHIKEFNKSMFIGTLTHEEMEHEHPAELAALESGKHAAPIPPDVLRKRQTLYVPVAIAILVAFSYGFYIFIGYETTAIANPSLGESAQIYAPITRTPLPPTATPTPTFTPKPSPTLRPGETPPTAAPVTGGPTWDGAVSAIFAEKCVKCHGASGGLSLDSYADVTKGGKSGPIFVVGDSANSLIIVKFEGGKHSYASLSAEEIVIIKAWIDSGALK